MVRKRDTTVRKRDHHHPLQMMRPGLPLVLAGILAVSGSTAAQDDPNVAPYIDDIFAYPQARHDGALDRGRPARAE